MDYLLRKFDGLDDPERDLGSLLDDLEIPYHVPPTILIAAYNANPDVQELATFVCTGFGDQEEINTAIDILSGFGGGRIWLSEGSFYLSDTILVNTQDIWIQGVGFQGTTIIVDNADWNPSDLGGNQDNNGSMIVAINNSQRFRLSDLYLRTVDFED